MTDQQIARYVLHVWKLAYLKWVRPVLSVVCQTAVDNRIVALNNAIDTNNVPEMAEIIARYLKLPDNSVMAQVLNPEKVWTAGEWAAAKAEKENIKALMEAELAKDREYAAMVDMHIECIAKLAAEIAEMDAV